MRVLVTGHKGLIGSVVAALLQEQGDEVIGFDRVEGQDILDLPALQAATRGCDALVHLAAYPSLTPGISAEELMTVNVVGTANILNAAALAGVQRVVYMSSVQALGIFVGDRAPDYLPIDDEHPTYPKTPYALSKRLSERLCQSFTQTTGIPTICLRPPGVFTEHTYERIRAARRANPAFEWTPYWEYGAFIDVRDVARAVACALRCPDPRYVTLLLCAEDISSATETGRNLALRLHPDVPWRGGVEYEADPFLALVDTHKARETLGWMPLYRWRPR
jgi:nucleoside-diphosphate-sugar epimerase